MQTTLFANVADANAVLLAHGFEQVRLTTFVRKYVWVELRHLGSSVLATFRVEQTGPGRPINLARLVQDIRLTDEERRVEVVRVKIRNLMDEAGINVEQILAV